MKKISRVPFKYLSIGCILTWMFFLCSVTKVTAQRSVFNKGGTDAKNYYEEIPYEFVNGVMFVNVDIKGVKRRFLFDTGAPVQITTELYNELKIKVTGHAATTDATGKKSSLDIVTLEDLKLKGLTFTGIPALVSGNNLYACWKIDGVIGSNLLRNSIVQIVPEKQIIILTDTETKLTVNKKNQIALITGEPQSYPKFVVQLGRDKTLIMGFDTGSKNFLSLTENHVNGFKGENPFQKISAGYGSNRMSIFGLQAPDSLYRFKIPVMGIAGCEFDNVVTETGKGNNTRIGTKLLEHGVVTLDFIHHFFYFEPAKDRIDMRDLLWPLKPIISDNKLVIGVVWGKFKEQVSPGDQIIAIDEMSCENMDLCDWLMGKSDKMMEKQSVTLSIKDGKGEIKKITIAKE